MSSTVLKHALVCVSFTAFCAPVAAKQFQPILSCEIVKTERAALKQAPNGVRRVSEHVLEIASKKARSGLSINRPTIRARWAAYTGVTAATMPMRKRI